MERPYRPLISESFFRRFLRIAGNIIFYLPLYLSLIPLYRLKIRGRKKLKVKGGAISIMNHCIDFEWFFIWHAARPRYIRFVAEEANMKRVDAGWFNRLMGVLGVPEDHPMAIASSVKESLKRGEIVHIFPEGLINRNSQNPSEFIIGAAWFACLFQVPLIPISEVLLKRPIQRYLPWWPPAVKLIIGDALHPEDFSRPGEKMRQKALRLNKKAEEIIRNTLLREGNGYGLKKE